MLSIASLVLAAAGVLASILTFMLGDKESPAVRYGVGTLLLLVAIGFLVIGVFSSAGNQPAVSEQHSQSRIGDGGTATALAIQSGQVEATRQAVESEQRRTDATQTAIANPTGAGLAQATSIPQTSSGAGTSAGLTSCSSFQPGETRQVSPGTFVMGDIVIDGVAQYDTDGTSEGTVAFFERESTVTAQWGAGCYLGTKGLADEVIQRELQHGCGSRCATVRFVLVHSDGRQEVQYYSE